MLMAFSRQWSECRAPTPAPEAVTTVRTRRSHVSATSHWVSGDQPTFATPAGAGPAVGPHIIARPPFSAARALRFSAVAFSTSGQLDPDTAGPSQSSI